MKTLADLAVERDLMITDELDRPLGEMRADTRYGLRAAHIFLLLENGAMLLQRTGSTHRHPNLIGSSVAGFVLRSETYEVAAHRRLEEELGASSHDLRFVGTVRSPEMEGFKFSGVFVGTASDPRILLEGHVGALQRWSLTALDALLTSEPVRFTPTFPYVYPLARLAVDVLS